MTIEITSLNNSATNRPTAASSGLSSDFETFLKMLTVQMQNQDPLNPVDSSDYAVQLATFSGVEQQVRTNSLLEQMVSGVGGASLNSFAGWLGKEALSPTAVVWDGSPKTIFTQVAEDADAAELVVLDAQGNEVQRQTMSLEGGEMDWVGASGGTELPHGNYDLFVASYSDSTLLEFVQARTFNTVSEVRSEDGAVLVSFANGATVEASEVTGLRD